MENKYFILRKRRAISSVVGAFFFLILMIGSFTAILTAMNIQSNMFNSQVTVSNLATGKSQEKFIVTALANNTLGNKLVVLVQNTGANPIQVSNLWIINQSSTQNYPAKAISINAADAFVPVGGETFILASKTITMTAGTYDLKVVTTLGNEQKIRIIAYALGASVPKVPDVKFFALNKGSISGDDITLMMIITNNGLDNLYNVNASLPTISPVGMKSGNILSIIPQTNQSLPVGQSITFMWHGTITGAVGSTATFSSNVNATNSTNAQKTESVSTTSTIDTAAVNTKITAARTEPILSLVLPGPMGLGASPTHLALYGVTVSNPLDTPITVTSVSILALIPSSPQSVSLFQSTVTPISGFPDASTTEWTSTVPGTLLWTGSKTIPARSGMSFLVEASAATKMTGGTIPSVLISSSVFTNLGEFAKTGYTVGVNNLSTPPGVNTYLALHPASVLTSDFLANVTGVHSGASQEFNVTLANMDPTGSGSTISSGASLSIYIPAGFINPVVTGSTGFNASPTVTTFSDGSSIISGTTSASIGPATAVTIKFYVTAPFVPDTRTYIFFSSASGSTSDTTQPVGAVAEIPVQVLAQ